MKKNKDFQVTHVTSKVKFAQNGCMQDGKHYSKVHIFAEHTEHSPFREQSHETKKNVDWDVER